MGKFKLKTKSREKRFLDFISGKTKSVNPIKKKKTKQGKKSRWIGIDEFEENHTNDRRTYYRAEYLKSDHWKNLRKEKLAENGKICESCGRKNNLDIHHLDYKNLYDVTLEDLKVLCRKCHNDEHKK
jgi:5-methylcytosine-specific restriction endonuclease McrA